MRRKGFTGSRSPGEEKWVESEKAQMAGNRQDLRPRQSDVLEFRVSELGKQTPGEEVAEVIWSGGTKFRWGDLGTGKPYKKSPSAQFTELLGWEQCGTLNANHNPTAYLYSSHHVSLISLGFCLTHIGLWP